MTFSLPRTEWRPVHEMVGEIAEKDPTRIAVRAGSGSLDYGALWAWAGRIAGRLAVAGVGRGTRIGVLVEPSAAMIAVVLGVLRSGAAYVPLDQAHPSTRIGAVLDDARVACVVTTAGAAPRLAEVDLPLVLVADASDEPELAAPAAIPAHEVLAADPAYIIYTSGSTGEPKGVLVEHRQLAASTIARHEVYAVAPTFLLVSPLAFDSSVAGVWGTLTTGGCLVVAASDETRDPERLLDLIARHQVTRILCVPSLYGVLLDAASRPDAARPSTLETVIVAGEALSDTLVARHFAERHSAAVLVNEYGPTEATVWASYRRFDRPGRVSIGGPVPGVQLYVLDDRMRSTAQGVEGELYIGGPGVSRGYVGRASATAGTFVADPFTPTAGARMYRTGDRVRWDDEGTLEFLGRRDEQVKIRGHRVELGAVENLLRAAPRVRDAVVVTDSARTQLTGFVLAASAVIEIERVHEYLASRLPAVMIPRIQVLDSFPVTVNGKVDRSRLRGRADENPHTSAPVAAPSGDPHSSAAGVIAAWAETLDVPDVPVDINFFDLGGNSFTMFQLQNALERHTGSRPSVVQLYRHTTVAAQAELIGRGAHPNESLADQRRAATRRHAARIRQRRTMRETS
ncbi:non-ribosomal peptide synthetase [Nocardia suismassiliense]|uniref:Non-ribosomal peptide synthetase n=1 Tax=Nocardia suismassiliense TaxID=2077092 RepID=A0ABW6QN72_9NOCA